MLSTNAHHHITKMVQRQTHITKIDFFKRGIKKLPERWRTVVSKNGDYLTD
jgi:ribosomal protein L31E